MKKKASVLLAGFSPNARMEIERHLTNHSVSTAGGLTDVRHKMVGKEFDILLINADAFSNNDIYITHQLQSEKGRHTIAVHGNKSKRRPIKLDRLVFLPMKKVARHLPVVMSECSTI